MSKKEKETETSQQNEQKIVTRYDRKMQKRKEQAEQEKREQKIARIVGIVIAVAAVCLIVSFPIRTYLAVNETFVEIGGEKVTKVEFDYQYNMTKNSYANSQYGMYLSYMGIDLTGDLSTQMYSDTLTWEDYFQEMTVNSLQQNKALLDEAKAAGFTYDSAEELKKYEQMLKDAAAEQGVPFNTFLKENFGSYATMGRLKSFISDSLKANAYYQKISDEKAPSDEEIQAYYEENKDSYDSVDFRLVQIDAELPTEPTELADPVEENTEEKAEDSTEADEETEAEEEEYEPSEAEIAAAMADAKVKAEAAKATVAADGDLKEDYQKSYINSNYSDWLYDASRKEGDTTIVEDETNHRYYVVAFVKRYLKEEPTVNARMIMTEDTDPQVILDEWKSGAATEDSFIELYEKYSADTYTTEGGLYEGLTASGLSDEMSEWLFAEGRAAGDATAIDTEDGTDYVIYYVGQGELEWKLEIRSTLLSNAMSEYLSQITEGIDVNDSKGNLDYIKIQEALAALEESSEEASQEATEETAAE